MVYECGGTSNTIFWQLLYGLIDWWMDGWIDFTPGRQYFRRKSDNWISINDT